jgi:hypothetical protein
MQLSRLFRNTQTAPHMEHYGHMGMPNAGTAELTAMIGSLVIVDRVRCCALPDHPRILKRLRPLNPFLEELSLQHQHVCTSCATSCCPAAILRGSSSDFECSGPPRGVDVVLLLF